MNGTGCNRKWVRSACSRALCQKPHLTLRVVRPTVDLQCFHLLDDGGEGGVIKLLPVVALQDARGPVHVHTFDDHLANGLRGHIFYRTAHRKLRVTLTVHDVTGIFVPVEWRQFFEVDLPPVADGRRRTTSVHIKDRQNEGPNDIPWVGISCLDHLPLQGGLWKGSLFSAQFAVDFSQEKLVDSVANHGVDFCPQRLAAGVGRSVVASVLVGEELDELRLRHAPSMFRMCLGRLEEEIFFLEVVEKLF